MLSSALDKAQVPQDADEKSIESMEGTDNTHQQGT